MNRDLIKIHALSNKYYAEEIEEGYIIPSFLYKDDGSTINLKDNRDKAILNNSSNYSSKFEIDFENYRNSSKINKQFTKYIKEFPIIIDKNIWNNLLVHENIPKDRTDIWNINYFLLDYLLYNSRIIIEIDSTFHEDRLILDKLRDKYIHLKYGLDTIRFYEYGKSTITSNKYIKNLDKLLKSKYQLYSISNKISIDYSSIIENNFIRDNKNLLIFIDKIYNYSQRYFEQGIVLTYRDIYNIDPHNFGIFTTKDSLELHLDTVVLEFKKIFNVQLYIHPTLQYTVEEVKWALSNKNNPDKWNIIRGSNIPHWLLTIFGKPDLKDRINWNNISKITKTDDNINNLINKLNEFNYIQ